MLGNPCQLSERGLSMISSEEFRKAKKEWNELIQKKEILQGLKNRKYDPEFIRGLEERLNTQRRTFIENFGKYVEWL